MGRRVDYLKGKYPSREDSNEIQKRNKREGLLVVEGVRGRGDVRCLRQKTKRKDDALSVTGRL